MTRVAVLVAFWMAIMSTASGDVQSAGPQQEPSGVVQPSVAPQRALLDRYCVTCHSDTQRQSGRVPISLQTIDVTKVGTNADVWEKVVRKLPAATMALLDT